MKVYVMTKAPLFGKEEYIGVRAKLKDAEKALRVEYPYMRLDNTSSSNHKVYIASKESNCCLYIREEEI